MLVNLNLHKPGFIRPSFVNVPYVERNSKNGDKNKIKLAPPLPPKTLHEST